ncbi:MAG TPA: hypothetical protein VLJ59_17495 [Mycobacteriales bacterium]|nr:hypothetical protein [Mycobacteriales bacterium]
MEEFVTVATAAGSALVGAMATNAWQNARTRLPIWQTRLQDWLTEHIHYSGYIVLSDAPGRRR